MSLDYAAVLDADRERTPPADEPARRNRSGRKAIEDERSVSELKGRVEDRLRILLETDSFVPANLMGSMSHALLGGGKRVRPLFFILMMSGEDQLDAGIDVGCAIEMIHTASLILDDLPCMDDATLRRRKETTHRVFGQSTAILAAISLLTRGMNIIASLDGVSAETRTRLVAIATHAVGHAGLAAGQELDLNANGSDGPISVEQKNWLKTGALFAAMAQMASILDGKPQAQAAAAEEFAHHIGSAFQALDDLLDATADGAAIGKDVGKDIGKDSMINHHGLERTRSACLDHLDRAQVALAKSGARKAPMRFMLRSLFAAAALVAPAE